MVHVACCAMVDDDVQYWVMLDDGVQYWVMVDTDASRHVR
jgi:hypothetical protein